MSPPSTAAAALTPTALAAVALAVLLSGFATGVGLKAAADQRRRARLIRYIQEADAQAPFVSGELRQALGAR